MKRILAILLLLMTTVSVLSACGDKNAAEPTSAPVSSETEAATEPPTEAPTEPSFADAYRAYREELEANSDSITDYNWQLSGGETRQVVFADIMGDGTPEMIYAYAERIETRSTSGGSNSGVVGLRILTYSNGAAEQLYEDQEWSQNVAQVNAPYLLFQVSGEKTLYVFDDNTKTYRGFKILRFNDVNGSLSQETLAEYSDIETDPTSSKYIVEGGSTTKEAAEQYAAGLLNSKDSALMISEIEHLTTGETHDYLDYLGVNTLSKQNEATTYDEAISYLNEQCGE